MTQFPFSKTLRHYKFDNLTKIYIASKDLKIKGNDNLILFLLARMGFLVTSILRLNDDSMVFRVLSHPDALIDLRMSDDLPFKVVRVFKSGVFDWEVTDGTIMNFFHRSAVNLINLLDERRKEVKERYPVGKVNISIDCEKRWLRKMFLEKCCKELDSDPLKYSGIDMAPSGNVLFTIKHFSKNTENTHIVTWVEGEYL